MQSRSFEYFRPATVSEAIGLLKKHGDRAKVLAGGQSLVPLMKFRLASPEVLVDIGHLRGMGSIKEEGTVLKIGALARHCDIETSRLTQSRYPLLSDAAAVIGDPEVRNMGTVGGSLAHADPASDWGTALLAFETKIITKGPKGTRTIPIDEFFTDTFATPLASADLVTEIRVPRPGPRSGGAYKKLKRKTGDFATVASAAQLELDTKRNVSKVRIALGAVGPTPMRARLAEERLQGRIPTARLIAEAAKAAADESRPTADLRGSEEYKRAMVEVYTRRALESALERAER